jgi:hypothetical protein
MCSIHYTLAYRNCLSRFEETLFPRKILVMIMLSEPGLWVVVCKFTARWLAKFSTNWMTNNDNVGHSVVFRQKVDALSKLSLLQRCVELLCLESYELRNHGLGDMD